VQKALSSLDVVGQIFHRIRDRATPGEVQSSLREFLASFVPAMRIAMERDRLHGDLRAKLDELRDLARGLQPPLLAQRGLASALRAGAERSPMPVEVDLRIAARLPAAVEAAAY
jgi:hypothetical protein